MSTKFTPHEHFGNISLSVQTGAWAHCTPREDSAPNGYTHVEIALVGLSGLMRPEDASLPKHICDLFEPGNMPIAPNVPQETVTEIRRLLAQQATY
jgi:hypothetical protein